MERQCDSHSHAQQEPLTKMTKLDVLSWVTRSTVSISCKLQAQPHTAVRRKNTPVENSNRDFSETRKFTSVRCVARRTAKGRVPPVFHDRSKKEQQVVIRCFDNSTPSGGGDPRESIENTVNKNDSPIKIKAMVHWTVRECLHRVSSRDRKHDSVTRERPPTARGFGTHAHNRHKAWSSF